MTNYAHEVKEVDVSCDNRSGKNQLHHSAGRNPTNQVRIQQSGGEWEEGAAVCAVREVEVAAPETAIDTVETDGGNALHTTYIQQERPASDPPIVGTIVILARIGPARAAGVEWELHEPA